MKLRFDVDQAEAFRQGIDCPKSIVTIDVDPAKLSQDVRHKIADRLEGIDVIKLGLWKSKLERNPAYGRIKAKLPTFESLMEAIEENIRHPHDPLSSLPCPQEPIGPLPGQPQKSISPKTDDQAAKETSRQSDSTEKKTAWRIAVTERENKNTHIL